MARIGIFYGSTTGRTKAAAERLRELLGVDNVMLYDVASATVEHLQNYDCLIFGTATYSYGNIQDDWRTFIHELDEVDLAGKAVALFGLGDQERFPDTFVNGMGKLYRKVLERGGQVVGSWPLENYTVRKSTAIQEGAFVGLPLDAHTQPELTEARLTAWAELLRRAFA